MHLASKRWIWIWIWTCPCTSTPSREGVWSSRRVASYVTNLSTRRSLDWVVSFVPRRFVQRQRAAGTHSIRYPLGPRTDVDVLENSSAFFLGAVAKFRKATISFVMFLRRFRREPRDSHWTDFHENLYLIIFRKSVEKIQASFKTDKNNGYFTWRPICIFIVSGLSSSRRNISDKGCRENQNTHFIFNNFFFPAIVPFMR
jgi:hypothetical protein